jgi:streptogramin lyase
LWFTDNCDHQIGRIATSGSTTAYNFASGVELQGITAGLAGNLWFAMEGVSKIGEITTGGAVSEYSLPAGSRPKAVAVGSDGNLWFVDYGTSKVGKITPSGGVTEYSLPAGSEPYGIAAGPDRNLWFTDYGTSRIGSITTGGEIREYALASGSEPRGITAGPGGELWFADYGTSKIGRITTSGARAEFALPAGSQPVGIKQGPDGNIWYTDSGTNKVGKLTAITEPLEELAPVPAGVSCGKTPGELTSAGCRALVFSYDEKLTATGEGPGEWGEYTGRLKRVSLKAYNPSTKTVEEKGVAEYSYDKNGRLRAEWDPEVSPALKTTYGYDEEGHVTVVSPPGEEPWLVHYGTTSTDSSTGRLLSLIRPAASPAKELKEAKEKAAPVNTSVPTLSSSTPVVGTTLSVASNGVWSNSPLSYSYQWEDCNAEGKECAAIPGAVNQSYTPQARDAGYTLLAKVGGVNAAGTAVASTAASKALALSAPTFSSSFGALGSGNGQFQRPEGMAIDHSGDIWIADFNNNRVQEFNAADEYVSQFGKEGSGNGQFREPWGIAISPTTGDMYVSDYGNDRVEEFGAAGEFIRSFGSKGTGNGQFEGPLGVAISSGGNVWVVDEEDNRIEEFSATGEYYSHRMSRWAGQPKNTSVPASPISTARIASSMP